MTLVRQWARSRPRYAQLAMRYGFLEILDPLELDICTDGRLHENLARSESTRTIKLIPWSLTKYQATNIVWSTGGRAFWNWANVHKQDIINPMMKLAWEFRPEDVTPMTANDFLEAAFTHNRYTREVVDTVLALNLPVHTATELDCYDFTQGDLPMLGMNISWHLDLQDSDYRYLITSLPIRSKTLMYHLVRTGRVDLIKWIVETIGARVVIEVNASVAFSASYNTRETIKYIISLRPNCVLNKACVMYEDLDLVPTGDHASIDIIMDTCEKLQASVQQQIEWLSTHLRRITGSIRLAFYQVPCEIFEALCPKFRLGMTNYNMERYTIPEIHRLVACGIDMPKGISASHTNPPEKNEVLHHYFGVHVYNHQVQPDPRSPAISWEFQTYTAHGHQLML